MKQFRLGAAGAALVVMCAIGSSSAHAQSFRIWIKAFIPNSHPSNPGYIRPVPNSPGKTMIPGPNVPFTDIQLIGKCYNTNNRGFSPDPAAAAKITNEVSFRVAPNGDLKEVSVKSPVLHPTEEYDCQTGAITCTKTTSGDAVSMSQPIKAGRLVTLAVDASAHNPCVSIPGFLTPNIKYKGTFEVDTFSGRVTFKGTVAQFPSYEAYVSIDGGAPLAIFNENPVSGSTAWSLLFNKDVQKSVGYQSPEGSWKSTDSTQRFKITVEQGRCEWIERGLETGTSIQRKFACPQAKGASFRLGRDNDAEALTMLGMSPAVIQAIVPSNPQPSFIDFTQTNNNAMAGVWNGLTVIKDKFGKFQSLKQPGQSPAKPYSFERE